MPRMKQATEAEMGGIASALRTFMQKDRDTFRRGEQPVHAPKR